MCVQGTGCGTVKQPLQSELTMNQLRNELAQVESNRRKLVEAGLLQQEHTGLNVTVPDIEDVDESRREVLAMFARDTKEKLSGTSIAESDLRNSRQHVPTR